MQSVGAQARLDETLPHREYPRTASSTRASKGAAAACGGLGTNDVLGGSAGRHAATSPTARSPFMPARMSAADAQLSLELFQGGGHGLALHRSEAEELERGVALLGREGLDLAAEHEAQRA